MTRVIAIIQARMGSTRFPGKSLAEIDGRPILAIMMDQLSHCRMLEKIVFAIPDGSEDDPLARLADRYGWEFYRGSERDVLARYYRAAVGVDADSKTGIIRLTGDDILPDPHLVDAVAHLYSAFAGTFDFITTDRAGRLPYGAAVELISFGALSAACKEATEERDREHVVPFVKRNPERFRSLELTSSDDLSGTISLSIDVPQDLVRAEKLVRALRRRKNPPFHLSDILETASWALDDSVAGEAG